jgi:hypothetical protein
MTTGGGLQSVDNHQDVDPVNPSHEINDMSDPALCRTHPERGATVTNASRDRPRVRNPSRPPQDAESDPFAVASARVCASS